MAFIGARPATHGRTMPGMKLANLRPTAPARTDTAPSHRGSWAGALVLGISVLSLGGCTLRPMHQEHETKIDSVALSTSATAGVGGTPFCLHLRHGNGFFVAYSRNRVEAWVTDGRCADEGPLRAVDAIRLNWRADFRDSQEGRQCMQTERCAHTEDNVVEGKFFRCATAAARQGNQAAYISSDEARCN